MSVNEISSTSLNEELKTGKKLNLIDVRTPAEFEAAHIAGSKNLPLGSSELKQLANNNSEQIVFICQGGVRAKTACGDFLQNTSTDAKILTGGIKAWEASQLPLLKGKASVSMERQVRITAGLFVFTGTLLGVFLNSAFLIIPGFVGAGLMYSGITDTCGMAMVLAKMPWNNCKSNCSCK